MVLIAAGALVGSSGCAPKPEAEVVIYAAVGQEASAPIFGAFHRSHEGAIRPAAKFASQPNDPGELVDQIIAQRDQPVADVFWSGDILPTIRLQKAGLLQPHDWKVESDYPQEMQADDGTWCGFAARGRVLLVNTERLSDPGDYPQSVEELSDPRWQGRCALASPLSGTAATHAAVIRELKGTQQADRWFRDVADNAVVLGDSRQVARAVASGQVDWGLTDSDAALAQQEAGQRVAIVFPDQQPDQPGTLRIPNTVAILQGAPHPVAAAALADFLVTPQIEDRLAMGGSAQLPISRQATHHPRVLPEQPVRWMRVDFESAAEHWEALASELQEIFR